QRHCSPGHRRHEQVAVVHMLDQGVDDGLGAISPVAQCGDCTVNDQHPVARDAETLQDWSKGGCFAACSHRSVDCGRRLGLDLLDEVEAALDVAEWKTTEL